MEVHMSARRVMELMDSIIQRTVLRGVGDFC